MGLFSKKDSCPVCGGEVKGLFLLKIGDKKTLCKNCSNQTSMNKGLLETATPEFIREHLDYRKKNAEKYAALRWDVQYTNIPYLKFGADPGAGFFYLAHDDLHDLENPVVFSFDQLTGYELYRAKKKVDDADTPGETGLETTSSKIAGAANLLSDGNYDSFKLKLTTSDPYWPEVEIKITFNLDELYGLNFKTPFADQLKMMCQMFKHIIRKEPVDII
ncbi:MAG: DUF4428 domain-containing protein [Acetatifactor sp.]|nr:DUF4428 domain-containing protein [Acetatifactor sp.]